jgi:hypothetical protein
MGHIKDNQKGRKLKALYFDLYLILWREECNTPEVLYLSKGTEIIIGGGYHKIRITNSLDKVKKVLGCDYEKTQHCLVAKEAADH